MVVENWPLTTISIVASVSWAAPAVTIGAVWRSCGSKKSIAPGANVSLKRTLPNCISLMLKNIQHPDSVAARGSATTAPGAGCGME